MGKGKVENLVPLGERTKEEQRQIQIAGGIASGEARRKKRAWADMLDYLGQKQVNSKKNREVMEKAGVPKDKQTSDMAKMFMLDLKSQAGDQKALELEAKIRGQLAPIHNVNENFEMELPKPRLAKDRSEKKE